ncbi:putative p44-65 outer membrane protein, silent [Anaplasma phagocytophilum str. ApNP]|uniref:Putative p44-65 outer membrane protein, silent n=1 Tax=Anaplasma phagocytophilum str. ApNP TaxID=1359153 RepID=A0A0F3NFR0_ANAPH|nr:putative p44-65 outer membrane protein, silent [Anaplasma phagocytophilum str. ApNP]
MVRILMRLTCRARTMILLLCVGGKGGADSSGGSSAAEVFKQFIEKTLKEDGNGNWPKSREKGSGNRGEVKSKQNDNAQAVAKDLVALNSDEKTIVAGLLAKTIEGGEVVEIRAVSSTFVSI